VSELRCLVCGRDVGAECMCLLALSPHKETHFPIALLCNECADAAEFYITDEAGLFDLTGGLTLEVSLS
jgi:hypothetical protein